ncbi:Multidrug resistance protein [Vibrio coralliirubri]|uniref:DMT family transporter n=1 Tax=Vibrio coralliirubri TaxID=1516159 RepID=UPI00062EE8D7|nr:SMR family transporter [Vibrio coralliirubri]CDT53136.1 Multidrug resistance protein [Vibrio coralliirubri]
MHWFYLILGIILEVCAATLIPVTKGFTKLFPTLWVGVLYMAALYLLSMTAKVLPIPITYAIWAGGGIVLLAMVSIYRGFAPNNATLLGMLLIVLGIVTIHLYGNVGK